MAEPSARAIRDMAGRAAGCAQAEDFRGAIRAVIAKPVKFYFAIPSVDGATWLVVETANPEQPIGQLFDSEAEACGVAEKASGGDRGWQRSGGELGWARLPVPRQKLIKVLDGVIGDSSEDVGEPSLGVHVIELRSLDQRGHDGSAVGAALRSDVMMPSVWDARSRFAIRSIRFVGRCHWSLPISFMTAVTI
jgi:hypothetical protein